jgi:hypothetical protein
MSDREQELQRLMESATLHWHKTGDDSYGISTPFQRVGRLDAGVYEIGFSMTGPWAKHIGFKDEELVEFSDGPANRVMDEINTFWGIRERYQKLGMPYRRGIMMYGEPGTGKSGIIKQICQRLIREHDGLVIYCPRATGMENWLPILNKAEPDRKMVVILEDLDTFAEYDEEELLQLLDGIVAHRDGLVFMATTNHLDAIPGRVFRPSRFDLLIEVGKPSESVRREYIESLCQRFGIDTREDIISASEGMTFAATKELLTSCILYDKDPVETKTRLQQHAQHAGEGREEEALF